MNKNNKLISEVGVEKLFAGCIRRGLEDPALKSLE
jgi:hypothetical protein